MTKNFPTKIEIKVRFVDIGQIPVLIGRTGIVSQHIQSVPEITGLIQLKMGKNTTF